MHLLTSSSSGSYPTVRPNYSGQWSLDAASHSLEWSIPLVSASPGEDGAPGETSGSMEFSVGGEEADAFFPVKVSFIGVGSMMGLEVRQVSLEACFLGSDRRVLYRSTR